MMIRPTPTAWQRRRYSALSARIEEKCQKLACLREGEGADLVVEDAMANGVGRREREHLRLVQRRMNWMPFLANSVGASRIS